MQKLRRLHQTTPSDVFTVLDVLNLFKNHCKYFKTIIDTVV
jgi:hypothetical protein